MIDWDSCVLWLDNKYFSEYKWWDRSKYNNDGVVYGAKFKEDGFYFKNSRVYCGNHQSLNFSDKLSIEIILEIDKRDEFRGVVNAGAHPNHVYQLYLREEAGKDFSFRVNKSGTEYMITFGDYEEGGKYHVIGAFDGSNMVGYVNGEKFTPTISTQSQSYNFTGVYVGYNEGLNKKYFEGKIKLVRIFHGYVDEDEAEILWRLSGL